MAVRDVIQHCIYGVDLNPLAVDLCKVALWLEGHNKGYPLTFLDHRIKCGNSLIGLDKLDRLKDGIPDNAFKPVTGDDKEVAKKIKARNRQERKDWEKGIMRLQFDMEDKLKSDLRSFAEQAKTIDAISEKSPEDVNKKQEQYEKIRADEAWWKDWIAANIWTSAFFYPLTRVDDPAIPTHEKLMNFMLNPKAAHGQLIGRVNALAAKHRYFHWPLEFPEIFSSTSSALRGEGGRGFDVVLGNPPWERIKLQEQEFFATRDHEIANAPNKAAREKLIRELQENNPDLFNEFQNAKHDAESDSRFVREGGRFPLTAVGDINTYALFAELSNRLLNKSGRAGIIVPTGIATDDTCKAFFGDLNEKKALVSLFDFENREALFPGVHRSYKFCLLTITNRQIEKANYAFFLTRTEHLEDKMRRFTLSPEDIELINPNTRTTPVFRTKIDAELTKKIYQRVPVLINERTGENPWGISFMRMFDMSNDSHLFYTEPGVGRLPLYEAKMIDQYDHRFASVIHYGDRIRTGEPEEVTVEQHADPSFMPTFRYWVSIENINQKVNQFNTKLSFMMVYKDITTVSTGRTFKVAIVPFSAVGNSAPLIICKAKISKEQQICLLGNFNTLTLDFVARQKVGFLHINFFILKQFPVIQPDQYSQIDIDFINKRILELVYTANDIKAFALDMGYDGPPFKWDEERRALLRAELDAYYAKLYGLTRDELRYILDPQDVYGPNFPGETFRVLKEKEIKQYGEYRTRRLVLEAWDRLFGEK